MLEHPRGRLLSREHARLGLVIIAVVLGITGLELLPSVWGYVDAVYRVWVPVPVRAWVPFSLAALAGLGLQCGPRVAPRFAWARADAVARLLLGWPFVVSLASLSNFWLACWVPHYLTWPWWADMDHFSMLAHAWDAGNRPYRDVVDYNFPGPVYLMWMLGKVFGWSRTMPALGFDIAVLIGLGFVLVKWSRVRMGGSAPGWCGSVFVLFDYLSLNYSLVAQRDWYATVLIVVGLIALETRPGRGSRWIAAALFGASFAFRPYSVLFIPAFLSACAEGDSGTWGRAMGEWLAASALMTVLAFSPLLLAGIFDDFLRSLRWVQPGGAYNRNSPAESLARLIAGTVNWRFATTLAALLALTLAGSSRTARTWTLALLGVALYKPLSPVAHDYLNEPQMLIESVALVPLVGWLLGPNRLTDLVRLFGLACLLAGVLTTPPKFCEPRRSLDALGTLFRGQSPPIAPPGAAGILYDDMDELRVYTWADYLAVLDYLKHNTGPETRVANVLRKFPFPAINAPTGRLTPFPSVGGMQWLRWVGPGREEEFARALETAKEDTVVVWAPDETKVDPRLQLPRLLAAIRRSYEPEARFGIIEVWRRKPAR